MTIVEFLEARLAEDSRRLRTAFLDVIETHYGGATMDDDPMWVEDMLDSFLDPLRPETPPAYRVYEGLGLEHAWETAAEYVNHPDYARVEQTF